MKRIALLVIVLVSVGIFLSPCGADENENSIVGKDVVVIGQEKEAKRMSPPSIFMSAPSRLRVTSVRVGDETSDIPVIKLPNQKSEEN